MVNLEPLQFEMKKSKIKIKTNKKVWGRIFIVINRFDSNWTVHCEIEVESRSITQLGYENQWLPKRSERVTYAHTYTHTHTNTHKHTTSISLSLSNCGGGEVFFL